MFCRMILLIAVALVAVLAIGCETRVESKRHPLTDSDLAPSSEHSLLCNDCQLVDVTRVIDGDTLDTSMGRVRLFGVDTPERGKSCFQEATDFTRMAAGSKVRIENGPRQTDSYGRRLAYVYESSGDSIDAQLISGGFAVAWTRDGQHRDYLTNLEENARQTRTGCLWK